MAIQFYQSSQNGEWVYYKPKQEDTVSTLLNTITNDQVPIHNAESAIFNDEADALLLIVLDPDSSSTLKYMSLENFVSEVIWKGKPGDKISEIKFDDSGSKISFRCKNATDKKQSISFYDVTARKVKLLLSEDDARIDNLQIESIQGFAKNSNWLYCNLLMPETGSASQANVIKDNGIVLVWSYKDREIVASPMERHDRLQKQIAVNTVSGSIRFVPKAGFIDYRNSTGDYILYMKEDSTRKPDVRNNFSYPWGAYIFCLKDGKSFPLSHNRLSLFDASPDGKYLVYYDEDNKAFFSYNFYNGKNINITKGQEVVSDIPYGLETKAAGDIAGWTDDGKVLLYDNYDVWKIDPAAKLQPVNLTCGYGRKLHLKFRVAEEDKLTKPIYSVNDSLLLTVFNEENKFNGFAFASASGSAGLYLGQVGPYTFFHSVSQLPPLAGYEFDRGMAPVKAANANVWAVKRQSPNEAPNFFITTDFKKYKALSDTQPQKSYNWLISEVVRYAQPDGQILNGILYKPENFDPEKKYPVIFNFYEQLSFRAFEFPYPSWSTNNINIPYFVSNGYLVFTPDINYQSPASKTGITAMESAFNSVTSAAKYLANLSYVDARHMALQGHSFGAHEANYIITHSTMFAAAAEMAGPTDAVSDYLSLLPSPYNPQYDTRDNQNYRIFEYSQIRVGATLWQRPDLFLRLSPVLHADKVTTPLLITHNKKDGSVPFSQGVEFYMAMRRLEKPCWMLQYANGTHVLDDGSREAKDYTIRLTQFYDHYLKGYPPPVWMTQGGESFALDPKGSCSPTCPVCKKKDYQSYYSSQQRQ